jgi:hypothetical protein
LEVGAFCGRYDGPCQQGAWTMCSGIIRIVRGIGMFALLLAGLAVAPSHTPVPLPNGAIIGGDTVAHQEVRLRKLHLVRPDLIPYPVAYDVYC